MYPHRACFLSPDERVVFQTSFIMKYDALCRLLCEVGAEAVLLFAFGQKDSESFDVYSMLCGVATASSDGASFSPPEVSIGREFVLSTPSVRLFSHGEETTRCTTFLLFGRLGLVCGFRFGSMIRKEVYRFTPQTDPAEKVCVLTQITFLSNLEIATLVHTDYHIS